MVPLPGRQAAHTRPHCDPTDRGQRSVRPSLALERLFEEKLEPAGKHLSSGVVRAAMQTREMKANVRKALPILRRVFELYRDKDTSGSATPLAMNLAEFAMFLNDADVLRARTKTHSGDSSSGMEDMSMREARQIFIGCQLQEPPTTASGKVIAEDSPEEMVFTEFIEAVCRCVPLGQRGYDCVSAAVLLTRCSILCRSRRAGWRCNGTRRTGTCPPSSGSS